MLLHVIESARPVHVPTHTRVGLELPIDKVTDGTVFLIEDVEYIGLTDHAGVEGLAAGRRIERRPIEYDLPALALRVHVAHDGVELDQVRVGVIKTVRRHVPPMDP